MRGHTAAVLQERGEADVLRRLRARWWLRSTGHPLVITVGGTSGVGKSTVSDRAAQILGIDRTFSTDLVRAVLRGTLNPGLIPALSESSFSAQRMLRSNLAGDPLLVAFEQQASIVAQASLSLVRRALKEGPAAGPQRRAPGAGPGRRPRGLGPVRLRADGAGRG